MTTIRPKKALGQHFLIDDSIAARIADTLADYRGKARNHDQGDYQFGHIVRNGER